MAIWRASLTIPAGKVTANLVNFPLYIDLSLLPPSFWSNVRADGGDIRADVGGVQIPVDVAAINTGAHTGAVFVKVPTVFTGSDTVVTLTGDSVSPAPAPASINGRDAVWADYIVFYWAAGGLINRKGGAAATVDGVINNGVGPTGWLTLAGQGNLRFTGIALSTVFTMGGRARINATHTASSTFLSYSTNDNNANNRATLSFRNTNNLALWNSTSNWYAPVFPFVTATPYTFHAMHDAAVGRHMRINGGGFAPAATAARPVAGTQALFIGAESTSFVERLFGAIQYCYLRAAVLPAAWVNAETANINTPATFYTVAEILIPHIVSIDPDSGTDVGGTNFVITGSNFLGSTGVQFDGIPAAAFNVVDATTITGQTPPHTAGAVDVSVIHPNMNAVLPDGFLFILLPHIWSIDPNNGHVSGGTPFVITGENLLGTTDVKFGEVSSASFEVINATAIIGITPPHDPGAVAVTAVHPNMNAVLANGFLFTTSRQITNNIRLTNDGYQEVAPLLPDPCCPPSLCEIDPCGLICLFLNILPNGPLWDEPRARLFEKLKTDCHGILACAPCDPDACITLMDVAVYEARRLYDLLLGALWPAIREANPLTAVTTMDDWLDRLGWQNCFECACRDPRLGPVTPYEILGDCDQIVCCTPFVHPELANAVKHGIILSLTRLNMGIIKNVANINWVLEPLGAEIVPISVECDPARPDFGLRDGCATSLTQQGCPTPRYELRCIEGCLPEICTIDAAPQEFCQAGDATPVARIPACIMPDADECDYGPAGPLVFCPGILAAHCIALSLLPANLCEVLIAGVPCPPPPESVGLLAPLVSDEYAQTISAPNTIEIVETVSAEPPIGAEYVEAPFLVTITP